MTTTAGDAMRVVVREGGEDAAALLATIIEQQGRDRAHTLPDWEADRTRRESYERGFDDGYHHARDELYARLFGGGEAQA